MLRATEPEILFEEKAAELRKEFRQREDEALAAYKAEKTEFYESIMESKKDELMAAAENIADPEWNDELAKGMFGAYQIGVTKIAAERLARQQAVLDVIYNDPEIRSQQYEYIRNAVSDPNLMQFLDSQLFEVNSDGSFSVDGSGERIMVDAGMMTRNMSSLLQQLELSWARGEETELTSAFADTGYSRRAFEEIVQKAAQHEEAILADEANIKRLRLPLMQQFGSDDLDELQKGTYADNAVVAAFGKPVAGITPVSKNSKGKRRRY